ncbi:MAG: aminotransferase class I/II-fold pyridoxal phosphate-dependent enzyme, partial [Oscillospiraceae bacterium]
SHLVAGFRCGWMSISGDKSRIKDYIEGLNLLSSMRLCSNVPAQHIIQTALGGYQSVSELLLPGGRIYEQREFVYNALNNIEGVSAVKPKAAFYIFPKLDMKKFNLKDDEKLVLDFLKKKRVLLVGGKGFNYPTPDHVRIVYLPNVKQLSEAMTKFSDFLADYKQ